MTAHSSNARAPGVRHAPAWQRSMAGVWQGDVA